LCARPDKFLKTYAPAVAAFKTIPVPVTEIYEDPALKSADIGFCPRVKAPPDVTPAVAFMERVDDVVVAAAADALA